MNKQIDKLLVKAGAYFGGDGIVYDTFDPKKFAELIVAECVSVSDDYVRGCLCEEHKNIKRPRSTIGRKIKQHFGVKE